MREYQNNHVKDYLMDTCLNSQDNDTKYIDYDLTDEEN